MKILESRTLSTSPNENRFVACGSTCQLGIFLPWHDQNIQLIQLPTLIVFRNWTLYLLRVAVRWTLECNLCQYQFVSLQMDCGLWSKRVDFIDCTFFWFALCICDIGGNYLTHSVSKFIFMFHAYCSGAEQRKFISARPERKNIMISVPANTARFY